MKLSLAELNNPAYEDYILPRFDVMKMREKTARKPAWLHFGAGNILRAFPCVLLQKLLDAGETDTGMIVAESYDEEIIEKAFKPYDNLALAVSLKSDGTVEKRVVASIAEALGYRANRVRIEEVFCAPSLQMVTMTITEKGYSVLDTQGKPFAWCSADFESLDAPISLMGILARLLYLRYKSSAQPLAMTSLDNCSHNGTILKHGIMTLVKAWHACGLIDEGFIQYLDNDVSFTWSMIDKITPRPSDDVVQMLEKDGFEDARNVVTGKGTYVSAIVNAEECEYLAIEDRFPNGRLPLEKVGVIFSDRDTVDRIEKMKVCTCLNPLHTCLATFGCMMGFTRICDEMRDPVLLALIKRIGYDEGMPVVVDPGVMNARDFLDAVVEKRLPNPYMPDTPQRIACDNSKKFPVRFGETLKAYLAQGKDDLSFLTFIPLVFAGYARYLTGVGDDGKPFQRSPDPELEELSVLMSDYKLGESYNRAGLKALLSRNDIFGVDLYAHGLGEMVEGMFAEMSKGIGAIRATLERYLMK